MAFNNLSFLSSDEAIIIAIQQNGRNRVKAEDELFKQFQYFIKEGIKQYSLPEEEAFDAYSDAILNTITNIISGIFEKKSSLKTYIFKIFSNKCVDLIRKKTTNKQSIHQTMPIADMMTMIADSAKTIIQELIEKAELDTLKNKIMELGENCRQLLLLFAEGHNDKDIAKLMEYKTADVVKTSRLRCLDKLRQLYTHKQDTK